MHRLDTSGRMAKWAMKLGEFDIQYRPWPSMKTQVLADFIAECTIADNKSKDATTKEAATLVPDLRSTWVLHIDGALNAQGSGAGLILTNSERVVTEYVLRFDFKASNNQAEYEALLVSLKIAKELEIDSLKVFIDSQLIVGQVKGEFEARDPIMAIYLQKVKDLVTNLRYFEIFHISRTENALADAFFRLAMTAYSSLGRTFMKCLEQPNIDKNEKVLQLTAEPSWMDPIVRYLSDGVLPEDPVEAK
ncbi:uncharacterized protein [Elaeis guineensis]|uniref:uncharacterized protein n=1 Tax=Elaeis guineensis var. tenera TaxID=51953 RepID=UPI003C6D8187